ncbi:hypothetical protein RMSM_03086 [Rhodopirellula maiorica SM1]|uniref:Uncharacterized protein n=1 Tax=Rhodopirellula maiorica SM1 TaxID=1265738 RepID=M5RKZ5_9BACT|nr:hypothetical protein RMSM_03086 [Rhodopirellula maiorica SM1]
MSVSDVNRLLNGERQWGVFAGWKPKQYTSGVGQMLPLWLLNDGRRDRSRTKTFLVCNVPRFSRHDSQPRRGFVR